MRYAILWSSENHGRERRIIPKLVGTTEIHVYNNSENDRSAKDDRQYLGQLYFITDDKSVHVLGPGYVPAAEADEYDDYFTEILFIEQIADEADKRNEEPGIGKETDSINLFELL